MPIPVCPLWIFQSLTCPLAYAMSPPWLYACHLPYVSLTIPAFCICSPPYIPLFNLFVEFDGPMYMPWFFLKNAVGIPTCYKFRLKITINVREVIICYGYELIGLECYLMWLILILPCWCQAVTLETKSAHMCMGLIKTSTQSNISIIGNGPNVFIVWERVFDAE